MSTMETTESGARWVQVLGGIGAILVPLAVLYSFFTSDDDYDDNAAGLIGYAKGHEGEIWLQQVVALAVPLLVGAFVAALWVRLRASAEAYRGMTVIGGTLFIAFFSTGLYWRLLALSRRSAASRNPSRTCTISSWYSAQWMPGVGTVLSKA